MARQVVSVKKAFHAGGLGPIPSVEEIDAELARRSLAEFSKQAWHVLEPTTRFEWNWHLEAICDHVQALLDDWIVAADAMQKGLEPPSQRMQNLVINVPPGSGKPCYDGGMVIEKIRGLVELSTIRVGERVLTHRGRYREVKAVHIQGVLPLYEIRTRRGRIVKVAADHPVLTARGWVEAKDVTTRDVLAEVYPSETCGSQTISLQEARILGYLVGDGCTSQGQAATFTNQDPQTIEDFKSCANSIGFFTSTKTRPGKIIHTSCIGLLDGKRKKAYFGKGDGGPVRYWVRSHDLEKKNSYTKTVPKAIFSGTDEIVADFLAAYWACDGCIEDRRDLPRSGRDGQLHTTTRITACTVSEELARGLQSLLNRMGLTFSVRKKISNLKSKRQGEKYVSWNLCSDSQDTAAKFMEVIGKKIRHRKGGLAEGLVRSDFDKTLKPDSVISVEQVGLGDCRCLTVDEDQSFSYEGVAVHNSRLTSVFAPAWMWIKYPSWTATFISGNPRIALRDAEYSRTLIESEWYRNMFRPQWQLSRDQNAKGWFGNTMGGVRTSFGAGAKVVGSRSSALFVDDPNEASQVMSETIREGINDWWSRSAENRVNDLRTSTRCLIMQRLHERDLTGYATTGDDWEKLVIPQEYDPELSRVTAIGWSDPRSERGELMFPTRFPESTLVAAKKNLGSAGYAGQHQQRPSPAGGGLFKEKWFRYYTVDAGRYTLYGEDQLRVASSVALDDCRRFCVLDVAGTKIRTGSDPDYSVLQCWDVTPDNKLILVNQWRDRVELPDVATTVVSKVRLWDSPLLLCEQNGVGLGVFQSIQRSGIAVQGIKQTVDKITRSQTAQIRMEAEGIYFPKGNQTFLPELEHELVTFPVGHDDQVDDVSLAAQHVHAGGIVDFSFFDGAELKVYSNP